MPPLPSVPKVLRVALKQVFSEDTDCINRLFFSYSGSTTSTDLNTLATTVSVQWSTHIKPHVSSQLSLVEVDIEDLTSATSPIGTWTGSYTGSEVGPYLAAGTCQVLQLKIARRYRGGHPRVYIPGHLQAELFDAQTWAAANLAQTQTDWTSFISGITSGAPAGLATVGHVNVSYFSGFTNYTRPSGREDNKPTVRVNPIVDPIVAYGMNKNVGTQRRRNLQSR